MKLTTLTINDSKETKILTASATYGVGFLTYIHLAFCCLLGLECTMYDEKIERAKTLAFSKLVEKAENMNAVEVMNIRVQISLMTVFVYGEACLE